MLLRALTKYIWQELFFKTVSFIPEWSPTAVQQIASSRLHFLSARILPWAWLLADAVLGWRNPGTPVCWAVRRAAALIQTDLSL